MLALYCALDDLGLDMPDDILQSWMTSREFDIVSVVFKFDPKGRTEVALGSAEIEQIEAALDERLRVGQVLGGAGLGMNLSTRRNGIDLTLQQDRIEVRSLQSTFSPDAANLMLRLFGEVVARIEPPAWQTIGHNFIVNVRSEGPASEHLKRELLKKSAETKFDGLGHGVSGIAPWLWLQVDESTLWLRLEPHRQSSKTDRIAANANFSVNVEGVADPLEVSVIEERLLHYGGRLDAILRAIAL